MRIAHISDVHIRLKDRHDEYREVFARLYAQLSEIKPDRIALTGDIVHSKIAMSPELVAETRLFLKRLSDIAPVDMIIGNHDMNLSNMDRMDALTPIVDTLDDTKVKYYTTTGLHEVEGTDIVYGVYSLLDGGDISLRKKDKKDGKIYIALYHGVVSGCKLDNEYIFSDASTSTSTFNNFDYVFLGDIHRRQFLNPQKTIAYPGSLIQQNHGEDLEKGFLLWDIRGPKDFDVEFHRVWNDYAYYTIHADDGKLPKLELPPKTRIRVIWAMNSKDISRSEATRLNSLIRKKYNPLSVQLSFKPILDGDSNDLSVGDSANLSDPLVQRDLLRQWVTNLDEDVEKIVDIDKNVTDLVVSNEYEDFTNSQWTLRKVTMENFMSYVGPIEIDFNTMKGVVGLFGNNASGKSVVIDAILYALFNKTTRNVKNEELVNKCTDNNVCRVKLELEIRGVEYELDRWTTRQYKKRSGEFLNARTDVTLKRRYNETDEWENLTETQRKETEKIIRNAMGEFEDFLITTLSTQNGGTEFLNLRAALRSDAMLRFLGLDVFNKKYEYAKDVLKQVENDRRLYAKSNDIEMLDTKESELAECKDKLKVIVKQLKDNESECDQIRSDINKHQKMINKTISIDKDIETIEKDVFTLMETISSLEAQEIEASNEAKILIEKMMELEQYVLSEEKLIELTELKTRHDELKSQVDKNTQEISSLKKVLRVYKSDLEKENSCPVFDDSRHLSCAFLKGYIGKKEECIKIIDQVNTLLDENTKKDLLISELSYVNNVLTEQHHIMETLQKGKIRLDKYKTNITSILNKLEVKRLSLNLSNNQLKIAKVNEDTIRKNKEHRQSIVELEKSVSEKRKSGEYTQTIKDKHSTKIALLKKEIDDINDTINKIKLSDEQYRLYSVYCEAMHRNGLPVDVLRNYLPRINFEINKILSDVVGFGVYLKIEEGETDIEIVMRYDGDVDDTRPAQMASGMEKLLINMAIRYTLLSVSNMNTPSTWFIDEGFGVLDTDNLYSMSKFFENVKVVFKNIVIITHIDALKDVANWIINIEKKNGISIANSPVKNI